MNKFHPHTQRSTARRSLVGIRSTENLCRSRCCRQLQSQWGLFWCHHVWLRLLLSLVIACHHTFHHFGDDFLAYLMLPNDLRMNPHLPHQALNPHVLVLIVLDEHVDVLRHLMRLCTAPQMCSSLVCMIVPHSGSCCGECRLRPRRLGSRLSSSR